MTRRGSSAWEPFGNGRNGGQAMGYERSSYGYGPDSSKDRGDNNNSNEHDSPSADRDENKPGYANLEYGEGTKNDTEEDARDVVDKAKEKRRAIAAVNEEPMETLGSDVKVGTSDVPTSYANAAKFSAEEKKRGIDAGSVPNPKAKKTGTKGLGIGVNAAMNNYGVGLNGMVSEYLNGDRVVELNLNAGWDTSTGANIEITSKSTNAKSVNELEGWSAEHGATISSGKFGLGAEKVNSRTYSGTNYNVSIGLKPKAHNNKKTLFRAA